MKRLIVLVLLISPVFATDHFLDCAVGSSGNGLSWATAWKSFSNITGLAAGDRVFISGSGTCSSYSAAGWSPTAGTAGNPIIYRAAQTTDTGHTSAITITSVGINNTGGSGSTVANIWIDGNDGSNTVGGKITMSGNMGQAGNATFLQNVHLSYMTLGSFQLGAGAWEGVEIDHNSIPLAANSDHWSTLSGSGGTGLSGYTVNLVHDNAITTVQYPGANPSCSGLVGVGDDGFQWNLNTSFYNNSFVTVFSTSQTVCQHQDFIQTGGQFIQAYNNYFENPGNYAIYGDQFGGTSHWRIFNNIFVAIGGQENNLQLIGIGFEGGSTGNLDDYTISNNTCYHASGGVCVGYNPGNLGSSSNSRIVNNLGYNASDNIVFGSGTGNVNSNNYLGTTNVNFVNIAAFPSGNWHLLSGSTNAVGQGVNPAPTYLTSVYTTDKDGVTRGNPWDLGAYQFAGAPAAAPTFSPVAGTYTGTQTVTLSTTSTGCSGSIWWNTNGIGPGTNGTTVIASSSETVFAQVLSCPGFSNSSISSAAYTINPLTSTSAVVSGKVIVKGGAVLK